MLDSRFQQRNALSSPSTIRINVLIKGDESKKVSIISKTGVKIQDLKRKIQKEYQQLLNHKLIIGLIQDKQGFTISNNSSIGEHIQNGENIYIIPEEINLGNKMHLSSDLHDNFLTLRYVTNSFCDKMVKITAVEPIIVSDVLPEIIHLGFWLNNKVVVLGIAKLLIKMFEGSSALEYFHTDDNVKQKNLLFTLLDFWAKQINNQQQKQFFFVFLELLQKFSTVEKFCSVCKNHALLQSILKLSKQQSIETIHQNRLIKIINNIVKGSSTIHANTNSFNRSLNSRGAIKPSSNQDYIPSFLNSNSIVSQSYQLQSTLEMIKSESLQMKGLGLEIFEKNNRVFAAELLSLPNIIEKLRKILCTQVSRTSERAILEFIDQVSKRISRQKAVELLHQNFLLQMNRILQQCSPNYHSKLQSLIRIVGQVGEYKGNVQQCLKLIANPYKSIQQIALKIIQLTSSSNQKIFNRMISKHMKDLIIACLQRDTSEMALISILQTFNNTILDDQCRLQFLALKGIQVLAKMIYRPQVQIQRLSAKGLLNISLSSRQNKVKVLSNLSEFLEEMFKNTRIDKVVEGYIQTLIKRK